MYIYTYIYWLRGVYKCCGNSNSSAGKNSWLGRSQTESHSTHGLVWDVPEGTYIRVIALIA